jgi:hypothetical protein
MPLGEATREEARPSSSAPSSARDSEDRRFVLGSLVALVAIAVFFIAIGRYEGGSSSTTAQNSPPADSGTVGGASLMPKGPSSN